MSDIIPYGKQSITQDDVDAVSTALRSDFLTQGPRITEFEKAFSNYVNAEYAIAVSNGTAALHLCALSLDIKPGEKVITTPITFAASANCVRYCGGEVVFADIDPDTYLLDINAVRKLLKNAPLGTYKGIIPVDFAGRSVNMEEYRQLADEFDLWIIEDACHAPGGSFINTDAAEIFCGQGTYADLAIFSFHPVKHIACGEGGMITTNDQKLYDRLVKLRTHGITKEKDQFVNPIELAGGIDEYPGWYMEMQELGYNYRLSDIQAALGISQLKRATNGIKRRKEIANKYREAFKNKEFVKGQSGFVDGHAYHLYVLEVKDRLGLYNFLRANKIFAQIHYFPCHLMPYYIERGWSNGDLPYAEKYYQHCISLPMFPDLSDEQQSYVIQKINEYYE